MIHGKSIHLSIYDEVCTACSDVTFSYEFLGSNDTIGYSISSFAGELRVYC